MGTKLEAIIHILRSRKFVLVSVDKGSLKVHGVETGSSEMSVNILVSTMLLRIQQDIKQKVEDQAADAGQIRNLQSVRDAVEAIEIHDVGN